ncbi:MAG: plastocyanin/azurin family copper-binding protein [Actinomycetota bacterium]|nr:plastocyanin/azurin family copper-binding protein [Actinomycetota bacterium]
MNAFIAGLMVGALGLVGCGSSDGAESSPVAPTNDGDKQVVLEAIAFQPSTIEIETGTTVVWTNKDDDVLHTVTSGRAKKEGIPGQTEDTPGKPDGLFDMKLPDEGDTFEFTFEEPGTYTYFCAIHAPMTGTVTVD